MVTITMQDLKTRGAKAIPDNQVVYLIVNSKPRAVIVPVEDYEALMEAFEDLDDIRVAEERKNDKLISLEEAFPERK